MPIRTEGIDHVALAVTDVVRSAAWYCDLLGLERRFEQEWGNFPAMVGAGDTMIALFPVTADAPEPRPGPNVPAMRHLAFRVDATGFEEARAELRRREIPFEYQDHGASHSIYFRDPDGHELEITTYEV